MTFAEAQQEFNVRYYLWATSEFESEIDKSFPNLKLFKSGDVWSLYQFIQQLDKSEQFILAHSLLKRFHSDAVKVLGESVSDEESYLRKRCDEFRSQFYGMRKEAVTSGRAGEKIKFATKSKLRKTIIAKFTQEYGKQCTTILTEEDGDLRFEMKLAGWIVTTQFTFGRQENMIHYYHRIDSEKKISKIVNLAEFCVPAIILHHSISFAHWLGISGGSEWQYPLEEDIDLASNLFIKLCGRFFEVVPKLLKGIEFEKIA